MSGKVSTNTQQAVINLDPRTKLYTLMVFSLVMVPSSESELDTILKIVFAGLAFLMLINIRRPGLAPRFMRRPIVPLMGQMGYWRTYLE